MLVDLKLRQFFGGLIAGIVLPVLTGFTIDNLFVIRSYGGQIIPMILSAYIGVFMGVVIGGYLYLKQEGKEKYFLNALKGSFLGLLSMFFVFTFLFLLGISISKESFIGNVFMYFAVVLLFVAPFIACITGFNYHLKNKFKK